MKKHKEEENNNKREEIKRYQQELEDKDKKYEELLRKFQEQTNINPSTNNNINTNNMVSKNDLIPNVTSITPVKIDPKGLEPNIIEESNNMMNPDFRGDENKILEEKIIKEEKEEDKRSKGSSVMFLKDKLMYQGNEEKILSQMNEQNNDPNLDNSKGRGSIIED